jgi:hypothetical protein
MSVAAAWVAITVALGVTSDIQTGWGWTMLMIVAVGPVITLLRLWRFPPPTISESIRAAQR